MASQNLTQLWNIDLECSEVICVQKSVRICWQVWQLFSEIKQFGNNPMTNYVWVYIKLAVVKNFMHSGLAFMVWHTQRTVIIIQSFVIWVCGHSTCYDCCILYNWYSVKIPFHSTLHAKTAKPSCICLAHADWFFRACFVQCSWIFPLDYFMKLFIMGFNAESSLSR